MNFVSAMSLCVRGCCYNFNYKVMYCVSRCRKRNNFLFACCVGFSFCFWCLSVSLADCFLFLRLSVCPCVFAYGVCSFVSVCLYFCLCMPNFFYVCFLSASRLSDNFPFVFFRCSSAKVYFGVEIIKLAIYMYGIVEQS